MKLYQLLTVLLSMIFALATACSVTSSGNAAVKSSHSRASQTLTEQDLANATYRLDDFGVFQLDNSEYKRQYGEGMTQSHRVTLVRVAFGDLDNDGRNDAAVILAYQSGGSGTFLYLVAMLNTGNVPRQQAIVLLGDRVQIKTMTIVGGMVELEMLKPGPLDPACCPAQQIKRIYVLRDGKWGQNTDRAKD
jgi:hypothetical protein